MRARLAELRRTLINFRRLVWPLRDVLNTLEIEDLSFFTARDRVRLREAAARCARLGDELQALSERAVLVHEQILDTRAEQMNKTILVLTAVTVIFMPLTVISGILGMNVAGIPFADEPWAFWVVARRPRRPRRRPLSSFMRRREVALTADRRPRAVFCNSTFESRTPPAVSQPFGRPSSPQSLPKRGQRTPRGAGDLQGDGSCSSGAVPELACVRPCTLIGHGLKR